MSTTGDLIAGRYRLVTRLGSGAMGVVWEARDERLQRQVALKQLRPHLALDADELQLANQRAMREARISARLHHPYAVTVFDVVEHEGQPCIILQFVPSMPLSTVLREGGPLQENEAVQVGAQVASALAAAHQAGIVHRDVKPGNILIADNGDALISDFGISRALGDASLTMTGMVHGTPAFLAPEVARGADATPASDVFSLGATLYAALEGHPPFGTDSSAIAILHRAAGGVIEPPRRSGVLAPVLQELLSADPEARPTMASVAERLERLRRTRVAAAEQPTVVATTSALPPGGTAAALDEAPQRTPGRRRGATVAVALVALLAIVVVAVGLLQRGGDDPNGAVIAPPGATASESESTSESPEGTESAAPSEAAPTSSPTTSSPTSASPSEAESTSKPTPKATPTPSKRAGGTPTKSELARAIRDYYALMPDDTDAGWRLLTPKYRVTHGGSRGAYEQFWGRIDRVKATDVTGTKPDRVRATITYTFKNGGVSREPTTFRLVRDDGVLKIDDSTVG
jgi:serine/threonine protein kinase